MLSLFDTLTQKIHALDSTDKNEFKMYVCGPTVYDLIHLGNARCFVIYDLIYRLLQIQFSKVTYVRNITDIDDKIDNRAKDLGISIYDLTSRTIDAFHDDLNYLNCLRPTHEPKVTDFIPQIIDFIQNLIEKEIAYVSDIGNVYFDVSKCDSYYALSNRKPSENVCNTRIQNEIDKKLPADFVLWKINHDTQKAKWPSPWGEGRPGWHIECSVMSLHHLGPMFDLHGGGIDLIFPHHTNELAQNCGVKNSHIKYWVHTGPLKFDKQKMSKSDGNFVTIKDLKSSNIPGGAIRLFIYSCNYKKPLDFKFDILNQYVQKYNEIIKILNTHSFKGDEFDKWLLNHKAISAKIASSETNFEFSIDFISQDFLPSLYNNLNTPLAISKLYQLISKPKQINESTALNIYLCCKILGII